LREGVSFARLIRLALEFDDARALLLARTGRKPQRGEHRVRGNAGMADKSGFATRREKSRTQIVVRAIGGQQEDRVTAVQLTRDARISSSRSRSAWSTTPAGFPVKACVVNAST